MKRIILSGVLTLTFGVMSIAPAEDEVYVPIVPSIDDVSTPPVDDLTIVSTKDILVGQCPYGGPGLGRGYGRGPGMGQCWYRDAEGYRPQYGRGSWDQANSNYWGRGYGRRHRHGARHWQDLW